MMSDTERRLPDFLDEYLELKHPEGMQAFRDVWSAAVKERLDALGIDSQDDLEAYAEWRSKLFDEHYGKFDLSILDALGTDLAEVRDMLRERRAKKANGSARKRIPEIRRQVFQAFLESEREGHSFAQTVESADALGLNVTTKSIRSWLHDLISFGVCDVPPASRKRRK